MDGKIHLERFPPLLSFLENLISGTNQISKHFQDNIRKYNDKFRAQRGKCARLESTFQSSWTKLSPDW